MQAINSLAAVTITGPDAKAFLQGQLSNNLDLLSEPHAVLASCNSAQGRVQAILTLIERNDGILAIMPNSMIDLMVGRLRKYLLRSKVVINDSRNALNCFSTTRDALASNRLELPAAPGSHIQHEQISVMRWWDSQDERYLVIGPGLENKQLADSQWMLADIRAGIPQVYPATHESFVAQMLNLDVLGGISFNKGCYTGQEIIARAHFRGAVKRRMFRFATGSAPPTPGTRILLQGDQSHAGEVVMSAAMEAGCEMLAVVNLLQINAAHCLETDRAALLERMELPYEVPMNK